VREHKTELKRSKQKGGTQMNSARQIIRLLSMASAITFFMFEWPITMATSAEGLKVSLSGDQEVPPVTTSASANGTITVSPNKSVSGSITVSGMQPTAAHIHEGAQGENGAVIIPLTKSSDNTWSVPAGAELTDAQYKSYVAGNLYVNVHSAAHKGGEIRAQLSPK
jgi:CHRD domain